jgi:hypothetical protein
MIIFLFILGIIILGLIIVPFATIVLLILFCEMILRLFGKSFDDESNNKPK